MITGCGASAVVVWGQLQGSCAAEVTLQGQVTSMWSLMSGTPPPLNLPASTAGEGRGMEEGREGPGCCRPAGGHAYPPTDMLPHAGGWLCTEVTMQSRSRAVIC